MDFTVTNKAPLGNPNKEPTIYPIDDQFFWIMPPFGGANFILLIDSGKFKNYDSLMEKSFIFPERIDGYGERKEIESTIPKIYIGS